MSEETPRLWSDFDGTAVALAKKTHPRNWSKYPMLGIEGYADFLGGVQSTGVDIAGIVSRRPDIFIRRVATARSVAKLGFSDSFSKPTKIIHTGSEEAKGRFVADQSKETVVGMLEDKPHKLGAVLLGILQGSEFPTLPHYPVVLGVVSHARSNEYVNRLAQQAQALASSGVVVSETGPITSVSLAIRSESMSLDVIRLEPYSEHAGVAFGNRLIAATA